MLKSLRLFKGSKSDNINKTTRIQWKMKNTYLKNPELQQSKIHIFHRHVVLLLETLPSNKPCLSTNKDTMKGSWTRTSETERSFKKHCNNVECGSGKRETVFLHTSHNIKLCLSTTVCRYKVITLLVVLIDGPPLSVPRLLFSLKISVGASRAACTRLGSSTSLLRSISSWLLLLQFKS